MFKEYLEGSGGERLVVVLRLLCSKRQAALVQKHKTAPSSAAELFARRCLLLEGFEQRVKDY